jgi:Spy/CpxP family protein refolding chaperone
MNKLVVVLAVAVLPAAAQLTADFPQVPQSLVRYLALTPEQSSAIRSLNMNLSDYYDAALDRWDALDEKVASELQKASPDSAAVGQSVVEMVMIDRDVEVQIDSTVAKCQGILTPEQKEKLRVLQDAMSLSGTIAVAMDWSLLTSPNSVGGSLFVSAAKRSSAPDRKAKAARMLIRKR